MLPTVFVSYSGRDAADKSFAKHLLARLDEQPLQPWIFERLGDEVPPEHHDRCHTMRGVDITNSMSPAHRLFEVAPEVTGPLTTIGIGDGGNEIGMGSIPWEELRRRLPGEPAPLVPCRIATDWTIVAGTSNWGAAALAAAVAVLRGQKELLRSFDRDQQHAVLQAMVALGPAVDGITRQPEATVDGLPFLTYIQPWEGIRRLLGFA